MKNNNSVNEKKCYVAHISPSTEDEMQVLLNEFASMGFPDSKERAFIARGQCYSILRYIRQLEDAVSEDTIFNYLRDFEVDTVMEIINDADLTVSKISDDDCEVIAHFISSNATTISPPTQ